MGAANFAKLTAEARGRNNIKVYQGDMLSMNATLDHSPRVCMVGTSRTEVLNRTSFIVHWLFSYTAHYVCIEVLNDMQSRVFGSFRSSSSSRRTDSSRVPIHIGVRQVKLSPDCSCVARAGKL